ncbi:hypothetical protein ABPG74_001896 [Tetrahymena malaccensis]
MPPNFKNFKKKEETQNPPQQDNSPNQSQATQQQQQPSPNKTQKAPEKNYGGFWEEQEDKVQPQKTVQQQPPQSKGKPNFLKKEQPAPPPAPIQPQQQINQVVVVEEQPVQKQSENTAPKPEVQNAQKQIKEVDNKVQNNSNIPLSKQFKVQSEYDLIQHEQLENPLIQFEGKSVEEVIAPGGVRLKQNQNILDEFNYSAANFQTPIVGSFLISKLYSTLSFQQKIRTLYAIQELIRKQEKYQKYFKHHISVIKSAPAPEGDSANVFSQEINLINTLVDNPNATVANEQVEVKFEFKSNLLPVNTKNNNKGPSSILSPQSDTNNTSFQNSQTNTVNYLDEFDQQEQQAFEQKKKGFDFVKKNKLNKNENENGVKSQQNIDEVQENQQQENKQAKKGFSFLKKKQEVHSVQQIESPQPEVIQNQQKEATSEQPKKNAFQFIKKQNTAQTTQPQQQNTNGNGVHHYDNSTVQENKQVSQPNGTNGNHHPATNITNQFDSLSLNGNQQPNGNNSPGNQFQNQNPYGGQFPQNGGFSPYGQQAGVPPHGFYPPPPPQYGAYGMYPPPPYGYPPAGYPYPYGYGHPPQGYGQPIPPYGYPPYPQGYGQNFVPPQQEQQQQTQENKDIKKDTREDAFNFIKI